MDESPELVAFVLANVGLFVVASAFVVLSYLAARRRRRRSYRIATVGFGFVVLGGLVEPVYQLSVRGDYVLTRDELLLLQSGETFTLAIGLGVLFYAITRHDPAVRTASPNPRPRTTEYTLETAYREDE